MAWRNWSREELIVAFNLYCKTPFGKIHGHNPNIIALAKLLARTPAAVSWKLANFARLDPTLKKRNISGAVHGSKQDVEVWNEFNNNWEKLGFESERLLAEMTGENLNESVQLDNFDFSSMGGIEREAVVRTRVNQNFFRATVLTAYNNKCCITGLTVKELLNASHIIPWSIDIANGVNPCNGLCLNAMHDRAFDRGLITVSTDYHIRVSSKLKLAINDEPIKKFLLIYEDAQIELPERFIPDPVFLEYHNKNVFKN